MHRALLIIPCLLTMALAGSATAAIYMYVDENGVRHFTNAPVNGNYRQVRLEELNTPRPRSSGGTATARDREITASRSLPTRYDRHIERAARANRVDPLLIKAIIKAESDFDRYAVSRSGARGLMQLMPETARELRVTNSFDPAQNIAGGARYFRKLLDAYDGNLDLSLAAYNAGPGRVARNGSVPRIRETRQYVRRVLRNYSAFKKAAGNRPAQEKSRALAAAR